MMAGCSSLRCPNLEEALGLANVDDWYRRRQTPYSKMIMIAGGGPNAFSSVADVNIYDPHAHIVDPYDQQWTPAAPLLQPRSDFGMATVCDSIYAVGGASTFKIPEAIEIYDPERNSWRAGPEMLCPRMGLGVTALNGIIFAVGGWDGCQISREVEVLDLRQGKWVSLPSMRSGRSHFVLATVNGLLYAAGGFSEDQYFNSVVEVYDPRACRWTTAQPMLNRCHAAATVFRDEIVVVGGFDENAMDRPTAEMLTDDGWTLLPEMAVGRSGLGVVNVDGSLIAFGGVNGDDHLSSIEYLDFYSNQWEMTGCHRGMPASESPSYHKRYTLEASNLKSLHFAATR
ncbi:hypothetical protein Q1695_011326 [Nippostrongylus brasiliensis]|nr:hypothetical protein Q1695_011326 [Nippostrongylus brasiliensis]